MARDHHFHTDDQDDHEGTDLPDVATAKCKAIKLAGRIICDQAGSYRVHALWIFGNRVWEPLPGQTGGGLPFLGSDLRNSALAQTFERSRASLLFPSIR